jgi:hypothetical protein
MPNTWSALGAGHKIIALTRRFGYPGKIDAHERVWLMCSIAGEKSLNGTPLGDEAEIEVTSLLQGRNELIIHAIVGPPEQSIGEARLEVRATAWLRAIHRERNNNTLRITGEVIGTAAGQLDLYVLQERRCVHNIGIEAQATGTPFAFEFSEDSGIDFDAPCKLELVLGGVVWYNYEWPGEAA